MSLPEFNWLVSCASVPDHHSFHCPNAMSLGYLYAVGPGELIIRLVEQKEFNANMAIENFHCARHYHVSITGPTVVGPGENISKLRFLEGRKTLF